MFTPLIREIFLVDSLLSQLIMARASAYESPAGESSERLSGRRESGYKYK